MTNNTLPVLPDAVGLSSDLPASYADAIVNDTPFEVTSRGIYMGTGGDLEVIMAGSQVSSVFTDLPQGTIVPIRCTMVVGAGTAATSLLALY